MAFRATSGTILLLMLVFNFMILFQNCAEMGSATPSAIGRVVASSDLPVYDPLTGLMAVPAPNACKPRSEVSEKDLLIPVLATRNPACIMCHAQINGDLVTDLGFDDPFFMGTDRADTNHPRQAPYYGPFASKHFTWSAETWKDSSVMGNIYLPDATLTDPRIIAAYTGAGNALNGPLKLVDFARSPFLNPTIPGGPVSLIPRTTSTDINVPGLRGQILSRRRIWIDSPSESEIRALKELPTATSVYAGLGLVIKKAKNSDTLSGLIPQESQKTHKLIATNADVLICRGDVIVDGTLFLNNLKLATDRKGCRLYVTGTVFIQGPVNYVNGDNSNLQISSATAIIIGMRSLTPRLTQDETTAMVSGLRAARTDDAELAWNTRIFNDRESVDDLKDDAGPWRILKNAGGTIIGYLPDFDKGIWLPAPGFAGTPDPACAGCTVAWAGDFMRKTISYTHVVLNAPKVYGRYYGIFTGTIIGEDVLFAVNKFQFQKDPALLTVDLLPLVGDRIFSMSAD